MLTLQGVDDFGDRVEPTEIEMLLQMLPAQMGAALAAHVDDHERLFQQALANHPSCEQGIWVVIEFHGFGPWRLGIDVGAPSPRRRSTSYRLHGAASCRPRAEMAFLRIAISLYFIVGA